MAIRTEMISIAMPQPVEAKLPGIRLSPNPVEFLQLGTGWGPRHWLSFPVGYTHNGVNSVFTEGTETCHQERNAARTDVGPFFRRPQRRK